MPTEQSIHSWQFYLNPPNAWEAMIQACENAKATIDFEQYIFQPDEIGERFLKILIQKADQGVQIRLLVDGIGSYNLIDSPLLKQLQNAGAKVLFFNHIHLVWRFYKLVSRFLRDHRKVLVIDSREAFMGGVCIAQNMRSWRDTQVRIEGEFALDIRASFEAMWGIASHRRGLDRAKKPGKESTFQILNNSPRHRYIYKALLVDIKKSKKYIYLATAYFVPSSRLNRALISAAKRGVDVRIMMPRASDMPIADVAAGLYISRLLKAGVKIHRYRDSMFHAKTGVVDDAWASIGSANLDNLSLLLNYETNIRSTEPKFIAEIKEQFIRDIEHADAIELEAWAARPFFEKCKEFLIVPLRGIL